MLEKNNFSVKSVWPLTDIPYVFTRYEYLSSSWYDENVKNVKSLTNSNKSNNNAELYWFHFSKFFLIFYRYELWLISLAI